MNVHSGWFQCTAKWLKCAYKYIYQTAPAETGAQSARCDGWLACLSSAPLLLGLLHISQILHTHKSTTVVTYTFDNVSVNPQGHTDAWWAGTDSFLRQQLTHREQPEIHGILAVSIAAHWWTPEWAGGRNPVLSLLSGVGLAPGGAGEDKGEKTRREKTHGAVRNEYNITINWWILLEMWLMGKLICVIKQFLFYQDLKSSNY